MTRKAVMNQLFNLMQEEYHLKSANEIESAVLDMFGSLIEQALEAELEQHLGYSLYDFRHKSTSNARNGRIPKIIHTGLGETTVQAPRYREGSFQPKLFLSGKQMSLESKTRFYHFMRKAYQHVIFPKC